MGTDSGMSGRTAIVTGASSGIGRAIAERIGGAGASVHLVGRNEGPMKLSVEQIAEAGGAGTATVLDVRDSDALASFVAAVADDAGRLDVMVNNAGIAFNEAILDGTVTAWRDLFETNVLSLLVGSQAAITAMRKTGSGGRIVNISSTAALRPDFQVYGASKAAVSYLTEGLRQELEGDDIRITAVFPGPVATNVVRNFPPDFIRTIAALGGAEGDIEPGAHLPDDVLATAQAAMATMIATPDDIADAIKYVLGLPLRLDVPQFVIRPARTLPLG
jgi:NADP-dependent 3-hydroxy acid dehydrogenase YdfG